MVRTRGRVCDGEGVHTVQRGLKDSLVPDLETIVVDTSLGRVVRTLLEDVRCLLIELEL